MLFPTRTAGGHAYPGLQLVGLVVAAVLFAACGFSGPTPASSGAGEAVVPPISTAMPAATSGSGASSDSAAPSIALPSPRPSMGPDRTVWLCKPGLTSNPCLGNLDVTSVDASGKATLRPVSPAANPPIDCFYVYPTVSSQRTVNANLTIDPEEREVALAQVAQFSSVCNVYAPMYRQLTIQGISTPSKIGVGQALIAYSDVAAAFQSYLDHYNDGRPIVFIGHSQGAMLLVELLRYQVDDNPALRARLVSALLVGGNVVVPAGQVVGGAFRNIPACQSPTQTGCVVGYSSFDTTPPPNAAFSRANSGLGPLSTSDPNMRVLCVNPAAPDGSSGLLTPIYPTNGLGALFGETVVAPKVATRFVSYPGQYSGTCQSSGDRTWLQVTRAGGSGDPRPVARVRGLATWGLHVYDVNIALGNLLELVRSQSAAYR